MTVIDDLATLRALQTAVEYLLAGGSGRRDEIARLLDDAPGAAKRVEAEIARLQQEEVAQRAGHAVMFRQWERERERAEAAEAEAARLRDGLRALANPDGIVRAGDPAGIRIPPHEFARALLAEDGAAQPPPRREYGGYMGGEPWRPDHPSYDEMGQ